MCTMAMKRRVSDDRYRKYAEAKARIPLNLTAEQYEAEVKKLAKKFRA